MESSICIYCIKDATEGNPIVQIAPNEYAHVKCFLGSKEQVNHPSHYGGKDNPYEAIKVIRAWDANFAIGNALKYLSRAGKKDPAKIIEDLKKSAWYIQNEIEELEKQQTKPNS